MRESSMKDYNRRRWRTDRDSNPGYLAVYTLSKRCAFSHSAICPVTWSQPFEFTTLSGLGCGGALGTLVRGCPIRGSFADVHAVDEARMKNRRGPLHSPCPACRRINLYAFHLSSRRELEGLDQDQPRPVALLAFGAGTDGRGDACFGFAGYGADAEQGGSGLAWLCGGLADA